MSTDELRAAAERWRNSDGFACSDLDECQNDIMLLAAYAVARLAADEAERVEREKPIDEEWLRVIGFEFNGLRLRLVLSSGHYELSASPVGDDLLLLQDDDAIALPEVRTRGQLLDLLRALGVKP